MTSSMPVCSMPARPFMIASSGRCGVDSSLNTSILPSRITTKSVNVPPVSTPILKVNPRDILEEPGTDGGKIEDGALRIALPGKCLQIRHCQRKAMYRNFAHPGEILGGRSRRSDRLDPLPNLRTLIIIGHDLKGRSFCGVDAKLHVTPPGGIDHV